MLSNIGTTEFIIIGLVLVLIFGSKKITEMAGQLGESTKELSKVKKEYEKVLKGEVDEEKKPKGGVPHRSPEGVEGGDQ